jgi:membrane fusion protein, copper/silver efflux system
MKTQPITMRARVTTIGIWIEELKMKNTVFVLLVSGGLLLSSCAKPPSPHAGHADSTSTQLTSDYYTCSMHPQVHMDKPGVCPICGMDLVKASNSTAPKGDAGVSGVTLNGQDQLLANVSTVKVMYEDVENTTHAFGNLEMAEPGKSVISARFNGRIERLHVDAVGARVKAGDPLFDIYSPDIVQATNEYLQAVKPGSQSGTNAAVIRARLTLLGITESQIRDIEGAGSVPLVVTYFSPVSGTVIEKRIVAGSYVSEGAPLYEIADLSALWNIAEVFESDAGNISIGDRVTLTTAAYPDKKFNGSVALLYPVVNADTRTIKVRVVVANPGGKLKPNMYTETAFRSARNRMLTVPVSAVLVTGKRNLVYVKESHADRFQAREVVLGGRSAGKYGILSGLSEGEEVVREGGYLVDSESQLKTGTGSGHQHAGSDGPEPAREGMPQHDH